MVNPKKKPPIDLNELQGEEEGYEEGRGGGQQPQPGELSYMKSRPRGGRVEEVVGGRDWKGLVVSIIVAVVLAGILIFVATPSKKDITTLQDNQKELVTQINTLVTAQATKDKVLTDLATQVSTAITEARSAKSSLSAYALKTELPKVPDMSSYALRSDIPARQDLSAYAKSTDVSTLQATLASLQTQITALQKAATVNSVSSDETRWRLTVSSSSDNSILETTLSEAYIASGDTDSYLYLTFRNVGTTVLTGAKPRVTITMTPASGDYVLVDEDSLMIDTDDTTQPNGYLPIWSPDVTNRARDGINYVRRVTFTSDLFQLKSLAVDESVTYYLYLAFDYK